MSKRGLTLAEAAEYCGVTASAYRNWLRQGFVPGCWPGTRRIDRFALDTALDKMSGRDDTIVEVSKFEAWSAANATD